MQPDMVRQPVYGPERGKSFNQTHTNWRLPEVAPEERKHLVFKKCFFKIQDYGQSPEIKDSSL